MGDWDFDAYGPRRGRKNALDFDAYRPPRLRRRVALGACAFLVLSGAAGAIERNLPPVPKRSPEVITGPNAVPESQDTRPIGANLRAVVFLGLRDRVVRGRIGSSVDTSRVEILDTPDFQERIRPYLGQPISRRMIAEIEAAVARYYRERDFPFVAVSTPPQEITGGVLQLRVAEFHAGRVTVTEATPGAEDYVRRNIRVEEGGPINSRLLAEDLDWLNRNPFRRFEAVFSPGASQGVTNLDLKAFETKPWQVFAGYTNSGNQATGRDRYFIGASMADLARSQVVVSYQATGSRDFWYADGKAFGNAAHPNFVSHSARITAPTFPRSQFELIGSFIESNETPAAGVDVRKVTWEGSVGYRSAVSNVLPSGRGDTVFGVEAKRQSRETFVGGVSAEKFPIEVYQLFFGWEHLWQVGNTANSFDITVHGSPGGLTEGNSDAAFTAYSSRLTDSRYAYARANYSALTRLPAGFGLGIATTGQISTGPLPETEAIAVGGMNTVRGYVMEDGNYDSAAIVRNELLLPALEQSVVESLPVSVRGFVFLDAGYGYNYNAPSATMVSAGVGIDVNVAKNFSATVSVANALTDAPVTKQGDWGVDVRVTGRY